METVFSVIEYEYKVWESSMTLLIYVYQCFPISSTPNIKRLQRQQFFIKKKKMHFSFISKKKEWKSLKDWDGVR